MKTLLTGGEGEVDNIIDTASGKNIVYVKEKIPVLKYVIITVAIVFSLCFLIVLLGFIMGLNGVSSTRMDPQMITDAFSWIQGKEPEPLPDELTKVK